MLKDYSNFISDNKLLETIKNPNFSIIVPGGCNGNCSFCFWNKTKPCNNYISRLTETMNKLPSQFYQLSLTGGEPTISPHFKEILESINTKKFTNTVLTSNGTNILEHIDNMKGVIKHVNISRHHYDDKINEKIFNTNTIPNKSDIKKICEELDKIGIDVTISTVLTENFKSKEDTDKMIRFAKDVGSKSVFFRKIHGDDIGKTKIEESYSKYPYIRKSNCPVCRSDEQMIEDIKVTWKSSIEEPSNGLGHIYELILNENGKLTSDWKLKNQIKDISLIKENNNLLLENCGGGVIGACGGYNTEDEDRMRKELEERRRKEYRFEYNNIRKELEIGDIIRCKIDYNNKFYYGEFYEIVKFNDKNHKIGVKYFNKVKDKNMVFLFTTRTFKEIFNIKNRKVKDSTNKGYSSYDDDEYIEWN